MREGLVDADLGALLYKKRIARIGGGKRGGFRTVLAARFGCRYVFLHGFGKNEKANITPDERRALQIAGRAFLDASLNDLAVALRAGVLMEVKCEQDH